MSTITPTRRQEGPARESIKWMSPVRSEALTKLARGANHLGIYQTRLHVDHHIARGSINQLASDPGAEPDTTHRITLPPTSLHVSHLEIIVRFQASEGYPTESDELAGVNFAGPSIHARVLTATGVSYDPPDGVADWAARMASPVGAAEGDLGAGHLNPAELTARDPALGTVYPILTKAFITSPPEVINQYPTGPRGLYCQLNAGHILEIKTSRVRLWQVIINEAPLLVV